MSGSRRITLFLAVLAVTVATLAWPNPNKISPEQRQAASDMLTVIRDNVRDYYYDPQLHGFDLNARYELARQKARTINTLSEAYGLAAWLLEPLNDSHTFFVPPMRPYRIENGWRMKFIGDRCYFTAIQPGSDAERQGFRPGDQVLGMEGFRLERDSAWKLHYAFEVLAPRSGMHLIVAAPNSAPRELLVNASVEKLPKVLDLHFDWRDQDEIRMQTSQTAEIGSVLICKLPNFEGDTRQLDRNIAGAATRSALILDLRDNPGGLESTLTHLLASVIDHKVTIGQRIARKTGKPLVVKAQPERKRFQGKLVVLIDSDSASAAEVFARTIQLEKRGIVVGDRSSGQVMEARFRQDWTAQAFFKLPFGLNLTVSDLIMADGKSLEHNGVIPDELVLPTAEDLAAGRDPVLSRAAQIAGVELTPEKAGKLFPTIWHSFGRPPQ